MEHIKSSKSNDKINNEDYVSLFNNVKNIEDLFAIMDNYQETWCCKYCKKEFTNEGRAKSHEKIFCRNYSDNYDNEDIIEDEIIKTNEYDSFDIDGTLSDVDEDFDYYEYLD